MKPKINQTEISSKQKIDSLPIFDKLSLLDRLMNDDQLARVIITGFLHDIPIQIELLKNYLQASDITGAVRQAHNIKGAAANVGGEALRAVAMEMEKHGKSGNLGAIQKNIGRLEFQFEKLKGVMQKEI